MGLITKAKGAPKSDSSGAGGGVKYICNVCSNDITSTVRIRCASKQCPDYDLCVPCFSQGKQNLHHVAREHPYQVIEPHSIPIFDEDWGADEELLLLEGAEQYGLGSWSDIADHIGGYREKDEVRDHYIQTYVNSSKFPLPERASPNDTKLSDNMPREEFQARKKRRIDERKEAIAATAQTAPTPAKPTSSVPSCHEVAGYMPGRLEFESEYFNEAEEAVQHMQFSPDEGIDPVSGEFDPETQLKIVVMQIYNDRLVQRTDRKKVIFNHRLLDYRKNMKEDKDRTKEQRDLYLKLKPFARMMSYQDFKDFARDIDEEASLRVAIAQLQEWRRMKICTRDTGRQYEDEKKARMMRNSQAMGQFDRMTNSISRANKPPQAPETAQAVIDFTTKDLPVRLSSHGHTNGTGLTTPPASDTSPIAPIPGLTPAKWDEENAPGLQLLEPVERDVCSKCKLHPKAYLAIKQKILEEAIKADGKLKKKHVREMSKIDTTKGGRIFEMMVKEGWIDNAAKA